MKNFKCISKENLLNNLETFKTKKICAMVKADAYGHGVDEVVDILKSRIDYFGVVNVDEGVKVRKLTDKPILICAEVDNIKRCAKHNLEVMIDNEQSLHKCISYGYKDFLHLKINCGMNRYGVKSRLEMRMINGLLEDKRIDLKSIYTHFPSTSSKVLTYKNYENFLRLRAEITQKSITCFGGTNIINYPFDFDMLRVGIGLYGYEKKGVKPVLNLKSYVSKVFYAKSGDYIGYGTKYKVRKNGFYAVVPVGYADGLRRSLGGKFSVFINDKKCACVGNICMDAFFVKVDDKVKVCDIVDFRLDAEYLARQSNTISYEILTGLSNFRGKTIIV